VNKGLGWLMLLSYGATGALIVHRAQHRGFAFLLKTLIASGVAIALMEIGFTALARMGLGMASGFVEPRISGLSQNPNAFAFMLILVLAAAIALQVRSAMHIGMMTVALVGIWFTASRAGIITVPVVVAAALMMGVALRPLLIAVLGAAAVIVGITVMPTLVQFGLSSLAWSQSGFSDSILILLGRSESNAVIIQHIQTIQDGLAMFWKHPILGAGLGAYMDHQLRITGLPLVIHSTAVWLLAETGIVGFSVFFAAACRLFSDAVRQRGDPAALLLVLILCGLATMSLVHEMLYQRAFWLLLGAILAMPSAAASFANGKSAAAER